VLLAVVCTWPVAGRLDELALVNVASPFDALIYAWNFDWLGRSLAAGRSALWTDQLFYPQRVPLALYTPTWLHAALSLPLQVVPGGERGLWMAYHLAVLGSFALAGLAADALARRCRVSSAGALVAGAAFAWCGFRTTNFARLNVLASELVALELIAVLAVVTTSQRRALLALVACTAALAWTSATQAMNALLAAAVLLPFFARDAVRGWVGRLALGAGAVALLCAPLAPGLVVALSWPPLHDDGSRLAFSLDALGLFWPDGQDLLARAGLPARRMGLLEQGSSFFAGALVLALATLALWRRVPLRFARGWWGLAALGWLLALGPQLKILEVPTGLPLPYAALEALPPLQIARVPARFGVLTALSLALAAGAGAGWLFTRMRLGARAALAAGAVLAAAVALEGSGGLPLRMFRGFDLQPRALARALDGVAGDAALLDLPYDSYHTRRIAMALQTAHRHPILFADYPRAPRSNRQHFASSRLFGLLADAEGAPEALRKGLAALDLVAERRRLRALGIGAVVLHHDLYRHLEDRSDAAARRLRRRAAVLVPALTRAWGPGRRVDLGSYAALVFAL